jgi:hypothetical protein
VHIHAPDLLKAYHHKRPLERIKAALLRCSKIISPHWAPLILRSLCSSTSSVSTDTSLVRLPHANSPLPANPIPTNTRSWTVSDTQRPIRNSPTVFAFPCPPH